jgi:uncharacterized protein (TIGR03083 family)
LDVGAAANATLGALDACGDQIARLSEEDWSRWTKLTGWRVPDLVWHLARGAARDAELIRRTVDKAGPLPTVADWGLPHPNDAVPAPDKASLVDHFARSRDQLARRLAELEASAAALPVPISPAGGPSLREWLSAYVLEFAIHRDDFDRALRAENRFDDDVLRAIFARAPATALEHAKEDGLQPVKPRAYRLVGETCEVAFRWDGEWTPGAPRDPAIPVAIITADDSSLARLLTGRAAVGESPQQLTGAWHLALDLPRWCGVW